MPKPRAYVETTIPNFYYDFRDSPAVTLRRDATRRWWETAAARYELLTSKIVRNELAAGTGNLVPLRLGLIAELPDLTYTPTVARLVEHYVANKLMPAHPSEDAAHLALASYYECDFLITWNCRHLANPNKGRHIQRINSVLGLRVPRLVTPLELLEGEINV